MDQTEGWSGTVRSFPDRCNLFHEISVRVCGDSRQRSQHKTAVTDTVHYTHRSPNSVNTSKESKSDTYRSDAVNMRSIFVQPFTHAANPTSSLGSIVLALLPVLAEGTWLRKQRREGCLQ